jgi:hypothetical protein
MTDKVVCSVTVDMPNLASGTPVAIPGLGVLKNKTTTNVTDDQQSAFRLRSSTVVDGKRELGPTLRQAKFPKGVTVEAASDSKKAEASPDTGDQHVTEELPQATPNEEAK